MKVTLPKDYRKTFTLEEMDIARRIIRDMKDDDTTPAWDAYGEDTHQMDIWVEAVAKTFDGYLELGAYLTDINGIAPNTDFTEHMYARYFTRCTDV